MIDNIAIAYCMAKLEDKIRLERKSAKIYLAYCNGNDKDPVYERMIARWSTMIDAFEAAFGVDYLQNLEIQGKVIDDERANNETPQHERIRHRGKEHHH